MNDYSISENNLHIVDSYKITDGNDMIAFLDYVREAHPESKVWTRSYMSLVHEWCGHNLLYDLDFQRERTADVDLDVPIRVWTEIAYAILTFIYTLFGLDKKKF